MFLALTIDVDSKNQNNRNFDTKNLDFDFEEEIKMFLNLAQKPTFFVRTDHQTIERFGNRYVFDMIERLCLTYDVEIGWHPHFFDGFGPIFNHNLLLDKIQDVWSKNEYLKEVGSIRIGSCQNSNEIMTWLSDKFVLDSSAMAGCARKDSLRNYDWSITKLTPYFPNRFDCRTNGDLPILEIPITTFMTMAKYDEFPKRRVLNCNLHTNIFRDAIDNNYKELAALDCIVACSHADELQTGYVDDLYCFGMETYFKNLSYLEEVFDVEYTKLIDFADWWNSRNAKLG